MAQEINYQVLRDSITIMIQEGFTYYDITEESGVHNIKRIEQGINKPKVNSWIKLHETFPKYIPKPIYSDGSNVNQSIGKVRTGVFSQAGGSINTNNGSIYSAEEQTLINLIRSKENSQKIIIDLITQVAQIQD